MTTDEKFLATAEAVAQIWSKDPSTKVGAVAVGEQRNQVAFGYNGFPPGLSDLAARLDNRETKLQLTLHAEENALANATFPVKTLYVTHPPCQQCALRILAARTVKRVVYRTNPELETRWGGSMREAALLLGEGGVELEALG